MKPFEPSGESDQKAQIECENNTLIFPGNGAQKQVITFDKVFDVDSQ